MTINGIYVSTNGWFGYDGCHKMYICETADDMNQLEEYGYELLPIAELPSKYRESCSLRFIYSADLMTQYCEQFQNARFGGFKKKAS